MAKKAAVITMKKGEGKYIRFQVFDVVNGVRTPKDLSGMQYKAAFKENASDETYAIEKNHSDFDDSDAINGNLRVLIKSSETDALTIRNYEGELKIIADPGTGDQVDKSMDVILKIVQAVTHD